MSHLIQKTNVNCSWFCIWQSTMSHLTRKDAKSIIWDRKPSLYTNLNLQEWVLLVGQSRWDIDIILDRKTGSKRAIVELTSDWNRFNEQPFILSHISTFTSERPLTGISRFRKRWDSSSNPSLFRFDWIWVDAWIDRKLLIVLGQFYSFLQMPYNILFLLFFYHRCSLQLLFS